MYSFLFQIYGTILCKLRFKYIVLKREVKQYLDHQRHRHQPKVLIHSRQYSMSHTC